jgi:hypothetical protein
MSRRVPEEWLQRANEELSKRGLPHIQRPFKAISMWSDYQRREVFFPSDEANEIVRWFEQNSPPNPTKLGLNSQVHISSIPIFGEWIFPLLSARLN